MCQGKEVDLRVSANCNAFSMGEIREFRISIQGLVTETRTKTTFRAGVKSGPYRTATVDDVFKVRTRGDATG